MVSGGVEDAKKIKGLQKIGKGREEAGYQGRLHLGAHGRAEAIKARRVSLENCPSGCVGSCRTWLWV